VALSLEHGKWNTLNPWTLAELVRHNLLIASSNYVINLGSFWMHRSI
jgi:hypothetical protein